MYLVTCTKCQSEYIGETKHSLEHRSNKHLGYIRNKNPSQDQGSISEKLDARHKIEHFSIQGLETINISDARLGTGKQENLYIYKNFDLKREGMNKPA